MLSTYFLYPVVAAGLGVFQLETRLEHASRKNGKLLFRFPLLFRLGIFGAAVATTYYSHRDWAISEWWLRILAVGFDLWFLLAWPPIVTISDQGIERLVWWKPRVFMPWTEVVAAEINQDGDMTIIGSNASITCSRFQNDPIRFRKEVIQRSSVKKFELPEFVTRLHL